MASPATPVPSSELFEQCMNTLKACNSDTAHADIVRDTGLAMAAASRAHSDTAGAFSVRILGKGHDSQILRTYPNNQSVLGLSWYLTERPARLSSLSLNGHDKPPQALGVYVHACLNADMGIILSPPRNQRGFDVLLLKATEERVVHVQARTIGPSPQSRRRHQAVELFRQAARQTDDTGRPLAFGSIEIEGAPLHTFESALGLFRARSRHMPRARTVA